MRHSHLEVVNQSNLFLAVVSREPDSSTPKNKVAEFYHVGVLLDE